MRLTTEPSLQIADYPFRHAIRTRFAETDAMGIVHHAAYLPYLEEARIAYLRSIDRPYATVRRDGADITVLEAFVQYRRPLAFDDIVEVHVRLAGGTRTTMQIAYLLTVEDEARATAVTVHGFVDERGRAQRMPAWMVALLSS